MHYPLDSGANGLLHDVARAVDVGGINFPFIARPQPVIGGNVKNVADAGHRAANGARIAEIALGKLQVQPIEVKAGTARPHQRANAKPGAGQCPRHRRADES